MKRIFYFNITYTCNSNCLFCYSHNTIHSGDKHKEITLSQFNDYLNRQNICQNDRIIINGGEPFLHSNIIAILEILKCYNCEILIYTNGRLLYKHDLSFLNKQYRFIIPIHGDKHIHDKITQVKGSLDETIRSLDSIMNTDCLIDIKLIINHLTATNTTALGRTIQLIKQLPVNHALHVTKMEDTISSIQNQCPSVSLPQASKCTKIIFDNFINGKLKIKLFDTCITEIGLIESNVNTACPEAQVFFKDNAHEWIYNCHTPELFCRKHCSLSTLCYSAVANYHVLEFHNDNIYKNFE